MAKRILIVEDEKPFHEIYEAMLEGKGYDIIYAYDGGEAMEKVQQEKPDLIIADILMNVVSGDTFVLYLKGMPEYADVPVIIISSMPQKQFNNLKEIDPKLVYLNKADLTTKRLIEEVAKKLGA
jgi:CheY-like chemotaxis protein